MGTPTEETMMDIDSVLMLAMDHKWFALGAVLVGAVCRLLKSDALGQWFRMLPAWAKRVLPWALGALAGSLEGMASGRPLLESLSKGVLLSGVGATAGHDLLVEGMRNGRELMEPAGQR